MNFIVGIGGPLTYKNAADKQAVVSDLPLEALITETDAPYLSPQPYRGQRNEPKNILSIVEKIAQLHNQPISEVARQIYQNAARVFAWGE
jgi:TatD DNase family protein